MQSDPSKRADQYLFILKTVRTLSSVLLTAVWVVAFLAGGKQLIYAWLSKWLNLGGDKPLVLWFLTTGVGVLILFLLFQLPSILYALYVRLMAVGKGQGATNKAVVSDESLKTLLAQLDLGQKLDDELQKQLVAAVKTEVAATEKRLSDLLNHLDVNRLKYEQVQKLFAEVLATNMRIQLREHEKKHWSPQSTNIQQIRTVIDECLEQLQDGSESLDDIWKKLVDTSKRVVSIEKEQKKTNLILATWIPIARQGLISGIFASLIATAIWAIWFEPVIPAVELDQKSLASLESRIELLANMAQFHTGYYQLEKPVATATLHFPLGSAGISSILEPDSLNQLYQVVAELDTSNAFIIGIHGMASQVFNPDKSVFGGNQDLSLARALNMKRALEDTLFALDRSQPFIRFNISNGVTHKQDSIEGQRVEIRIFKVPHSTL